MSTVPLSGAVYYTLRIFFIMIILVTLGLQPPSAFVPLLNFMMKMFQTFFHTTRYTHLDNQHGL